MVILRESCMVKGKLINKNKNIKKKRQFRAIFIYLFFGRGDGGCG